jgi:hypothetical protein
MELMYAVHDSLREMVSWKWPPFYPDNGYKIPYFDPVRLYIERDVATNNKLSDY